MNDWLDRASYISSFFSGCLRLQRSQDWSDEEWEQWYQASLGLRNPDCRGPGDFRAVPSTASKCFEKLMVHIEKWQVPLVGGLEHFFFPCIGIYWE